MLGKWDTAMAGCWGARVLQHQSTGVLEYRGTGVLGYQGAVVPWWCSRVPRVPGCRYAKALVNQGDGCHNAGMLGKWDAMMSGHWCTWGHGGGVPQLWYGRMLGCQGTRVPRRMVPWSWGTRVPQCHGAGRLTYNGAGVPGYWVP